MKISSEIEFFNLWALRETGWFPKVGAYFGEGDATKHFSVKRRVFFSEKGEGNSVNEEFQLFGKDFYRKDNSVRSSKPFSDPPVAPDFDN